jgi:hypothetical protein
MPARDDLLGHLVGTWTLTGRRGSEALRQRVTAEWALAGQYLRMHFVEIDPPDGTTPYEAVYMLGRDASNGAYILQLFDIFGSQYSRVPGIGTRRGDAIEFLFDYPDGGFSNTFTWAPDRDEWEMLLRERGGSGDWKTWATKKLQRAC